VANADPAIPSGKRGAEIERTTRCRKGFLGLQQMECAILLHK